MKNPTCLEKVTDYGLWTEYLDPDGYTTKDEFDAMSVEEKLQFVHETWPMDYLAALRLARRFAWALHDKLVEQGLGKDEIYAHPDYQKAVARERKFFCLWQG